jgi:hypothetical protein
MRFRPIVTLALSISLASCDHTAPFTVDAREPAGPWNAAPPIRLTFNVGDDRHPAVHDDLIVFSRLEAGRADFDRCLAFLPIGVGTLSRVSCVGKMTPDTLVDAVVDPALSPDGRVAYVRDQGVPFRNGPSTRHLVIAPLDAPDTPTATYTISFAWPDGRRVLALRQVSWSHADLLRFIAGQETYPSTPTLPDTVFTSFGIAELSVATGIFEKIAGTESARSYASAPDDGIWFVREGAPDTLLYLAPGSAQPTVVGSFSGPVMFLSVVDGGPVGALRTDPPRVEWLDVASGVPGGVVPVPGLAGRLAGVSSSRRFVAEIWSGASADLWLLELP